MMKGDFSRNTFDPRNHFSRVLMQQGRVTLDSDANEQTAILLHYMQTLARDLIGPYAAPIVDGGFTLSADDKGVWIAAGRYYVDGILVENDEPCLYSAQRDYPLPANDDLDKEFKENKGDVFWVYLDVWERHITSIEDAAIRETALGGPDTCTRAKVVWQVKGLKALAALNDERARLEKQLSQAKDPAVKKEIQARIAVIDAEIAMLGDKPGYPRVSDTQMCQEPLDDLVTISDALLAARVDPGYSPDDACVTPPDSKYRGRENHLYRVEIHNSGSATGATFKWSRDNGSVAASWLGTAGYDLQVSNSRGFSAGNWVELTDDVADLHGTAGVLVKLSNVQTGLLSVDPDSAANQTVLAWSETLRYPKVRRWDQIQTDDVILSGGAVPVTETAANAKPSEVVWIDLEDGIQIQFSAGGEYRAGDYWLIPARVATGNIEWPEANDAGKTSPKMLPPQGIEHHYAPLGFVKWKDKKMVSLSCRCEFEPLSSCFSLGSTAVGAHLVKPQRETNVVVTTDEDVVKKTPRVARKKKTE